MTRSKPAADLLKTVVCWLVAIPLTLHSLPANAQYMYLDANGDGENTSTDRLNVPGGTQVSIWLHTDENRDGSIAVCAGSSSAVSSPTAAMTISSYEFVLKVSGGTVQWGDYVNNQPTLSVSLGSSSDSTELYVGYGGANPLTPGHYKLGTITCLVASGKPSIAIAPATSQGGGATTFGSGCGGSSGDNTLRLGVDWVDTDGLAASFPYVGFRETFDYPAGTAPVPWNQQGNQWVSNSNVNVPWALNDSTCAPVYGRFSPSAAGQWDCGDYFSGVTNSFTLDTPLNLSQMLDYRYSFVERHVLVEDINIGDDTFWYAFGAGPAENNVPALTVIDLKGNQPFWQRRWYPVNTSLNNVTNAYKFAKPIFGFYTYHIAAGGAWIDSVQIVGKTRPDIYASPVTIHGNVLNTAPTSGQPWRVTFALGNSGDTTTIYQDFPGTKFRVELYLDDGIIPFAFRDEDPITAGGVRSINWSLSATYANGAPIPAGPHTVRLLLDSTNEVYEADATHEFELNNQVPRFGLPPSKFWQAPPPPDLPDIRIESLDIVTIPAATSPISRAASIGAVVDTPTVRVGQVVTFEAKVKNWGTERVSTPFYVGFYKNRPSPPMYLGSAPDDSFGIASLEEGETRTVQFHVTSHQAGLWHSYVFADYHNAVSELSEANNIDSTLTKWAANTIFVRGKFTFTDSLWAFLKTTGCVDIVLYDWDSPTKIDSLTVAWAVTDSGNFYFRGVLNADDTDGSYLDPFVRVKYRSNENCWNAAYPGNWFVRVLKAHPDSIWYHDSGGFTDVQDDLDVGAVSPGTAGQKAALHILNVLISEGWSVIRDLGTPPSEKVPPVWVRYAPGLNEATGALGDTIFVCGLDGIGLGPDPYDDAVLLHEYAHVQMRRLGIFQPPGTHLLYGSTNRDLAWTEGFGNFFGALKGGKPWMPTYGYYADRGRTLSGELHGLLWNLESDSFYVAKPNGQQDFAGNVGYFLHRGPLWEGAVAGALWDVYDSGVEPSSMTRLGDVANETFGSMWAVLRRAKPPEGVPYPDVHAFQSKLIETMAFDRRNAVRNVFLDYGISGYIHPDSAYVLTGIDNSGESGAPLIRLTGAYPNPSQGGVNFEVGFRGAGVGRVRLKIFDVGGRLVREMVRPRLVAGANVMYWDGRSESGVSVGSGVYFCEVESGNSRDRAKLVVIK